MAANLSITAGGNGASQTNTNNPQTATSQSGGPSTSSSTGVQPGTTNTLLTSKTGGIPLGAQNLTTVDLSKTTKTTATVASASSAPKTKENEFNPIFGVLAAALLVCFVISIVWTMRSAKSTTNY